MKIKIIGAGLSGLVAARILNERGHMVKIFETRSHIGGNCYDSNLNGVMVHNYGPHFFHTNDEEVFNFLSQYTEWIPFYNRPKGNTKLGLISLPYSQKTISELGRELSPEEMIDVIFKDYSEKQWGMPFEQIPSVILNRIPRTKTCSDPSWYEGEKYQCLPKVGYTKMMENILGNVNVKLGCTQYEWKTCISDLTIYTGKIDEYFDYIYGKLPYRSLEFKHHITSTRLSHPLINQNMLSVPYTRIYDHSYFGPAYNGTSVITKEYPKECGDTDIPYYPIPFGDGKELYLKYKLLADKESNVIFLGRLATYSYLDMWMVVKQAIKKASEICY